MKSNQITTNNINNPEFVLNNLDYFQATEVIYRYVNHADFTEEFIIKNLNYFGKTLEIILKTKSTLSDGFFKTICTKSSYSNIKCVRKLLEPSRDFSNLDNLFY
jgi:hypothetical protein